MLDLEGWLRLDTVARTRERARARDRARAEAASHHAWISVPTDETTPSGGELAGIPFGVKDNIDVAGQSTAAGSPLLADRLAEVDAEVVGVLREAGAVVLGRTNMDELALGATSENATHGPVRNPHDPTRVAGGSSGGSAAAVALGSVPFALGTDTSGSVTVPSSCCGVVGLRPTTGRYPGTGVVGLSWSRDTVGVHARSVADARTVDRVLRHTPATGSAPGRGRLPSGAADVDPARPLVLGRIRSRVRDCEAEVARRVEAALELLRAAGVRVVDVDVADDLATASEAGVELIFQEAAQTLPERYARGRGRPPGVGELTGRIASPATRAQVAAMARTDTSAHAYERSRRARWGLQRRYAATFAAAGVDALVGPSVAVLPPRVGAGGLMDVDGAPRPTIPTLLRNAAPGSLAGVPMLSVPAGRSAGGLPVGLTLEGPWGADEQLLDVGERIESILHG